MQKWYPSNEAIIGQARATEYHSSARYWTARNSAHLLHRLYCFKVQILLLVSSSLQIVWILTMEKPASRCIILAAPRRRRK